jgi:hypothetical protein
MVANGCDIIANGILHWFSRSFEVGAQYSVDRKNLGLQFPNTLNLGHHHKAYQALQLIIPLSIAWN